MLRTWESVERDRASADFPFHIRGKTFNVSQFGKQTSCLRIHRLPGIMNNDILQKYSTFETVTKVGFEKQGNYENGMRCVFMQVSMAEKLDIPHLL